MVQYKDTRTKRPLLLRGATFCALVLLLGGCASGAAEAQADASSQSADAFSQSAARTEVEPGFRADQAERVLSFGFDVVADRSLDQTTVQSLALEGLRGLGTLDPGLSIQLDGGLVQLHWPERLIATFPAPSPHDAAGWATISVDVILAARNVSPAIQDADAERIYQAVFDSLLAHLDHFSRYAGAEEASNHRASRNGFGGLGIRYTHEEHKLLVQEVLDNTPAQGAGVQVGDRILRIDGRRISDFADRRDITYALRGPINSSIRLALERAGGEVEVFMRRALVVPQTVSLESTESGIIHLKISSFNQNTARSVAETIDTARRRLGRDFSGLLLDMRGNPGGLLDQAVGVSDLFLNHGRIVSTRGRHPEAQQSYTARSGDILDGMPIVVLLDGRSASAAEIVGAALQDAERAVVVGSASYGKGTVQTVIRLPNEGEITLTWPRFHTPVGYALHGLGVLPTVCIRDNSEQADEVLNRILVGEDRVADHLYQWRASSIEDTAQRSSLRALCPPNNHADWTLDREIAKRLLLNPPLYRQVVLTTSPSRATATGHLPAGYSGR